MATRKKRVLTVVITGIASRLGRMLARTLHRDMRVIGIDPRGARHMPKDVTVHTIDIRRRKAEDIFRRNRIDAVIHLNPETDLRRTRAESRSLTVIGTHKVLDYCRLHQVPKLVVLSTANLYGPSPENNQFLKEDSPLLAGQRFPTMRDLVEVDMYTQSYFWRHPEIDTVLLRPVNIVGRLNNTASRYLRMKVTPTLLGFDPMIQVVSPEDVAYATRLALKPGIRGIYNIAGPGPLPLSALIRRIGHQPLPVPEPVARFAIGLLSGAGVGAVPTEELDYLKYVCMVDGRNAMDVLRYEPQKTLDQTLDPLKTV